MAEINGLKLQKLDRAFYERETLDVSKDLLGKYLVHNVSGKLLVSKIIETEAYKENDKAAHFYNGRRTERTEVIFNKGGVAYVYLIYGMYNCFNVVTEVKDVPGAVLVRKLQPIYEIEEMMKNRKISDSKKAKHLCDGPGKLCMAMAINRKHNGVDLTGEELFIAQDINSNEKIQMKSGKRINIDYAGEDMHLLWRFYIM